LGGLGAGEGGDRLEGVEAVAGRLEVEAARLDGGAAAGGVPLRVGVGVAFLGAELEEVRVSFGGVLAFDEAVAEAVGFLPFEGGFGVEGFLVGDGGRLDVLGEAVRVVADLAAGVL
jgi:hypothetical protein